MINISDDSSTESDVLDSDSNSSPDSVQDNNDDVIFVDQTSYQMGTLTVYFMVQLIISTHPDDFHLQHHWSKQKQLIFTFILP